MHVAADSLEIYFYTIYIWYFLFNWRFLGLGVVHLLQVLCELKITYYKTCVALWSMNIKNKRENTAYGTASELFSYVEGFVVDTKL